MYKSGKTATALDSFSMCFIRKEIHGLCAVEKGPPTAEKLRKSWRNKLILECGNGASK
jgi:hypothetical protein